MGDVRPEYIFLGYLAEGPAHGYQIYRYFKEDMEGLWHVSESQMYASLKRLERRGWIALDAATDDEVDTGSGLVGATGSGAVGKAGITQLKAAEGEGRQGRQRFALTAPGLAAYEAWLNTPTAASPRLLKLEFLTRLYFALRRDVELAYTLIEAQRLALEGALERLLRSQERPASGSNPGSGAAAPKAETAPRLPRGAGRSGDLLFDITILARDFRIRQLRSALEWLQGLM